MKLTMVHANPARLEGGRFIVDRKFHLGMTTFATKVHAPLISIHPEIPGEQVMDAIEVPVSELPYEVAIVKVDRHRRPLVTELPRLRQYIASSRLVYGGGLRSSEIARSFKVPYILILEYDMQTQIAVTVTHTNSAVRRAIRALRCAWTYATTEIPDMRAAHSLHCNGYPIYDATQPYNLNRLMYLDSRMSSGDVIDSDQLLERLAQRPKRPLRLLYSGRYERLKGVDDAVRAAVECQQRGLDIEMHCYGQGSLRGEMERIAAAAPQPHKIHIHEALPYPELVELSRSFDVFVCCHIQSDPSCTYLESFGAGLPIVGYANRMWRRLNETSGAGIVATLGRPDHIADGVQWLLEDFDTLAMMSRQARTFALEHSFESEFDKRIDALNGALT